MNCSEWEDRLALYAGGDLPAGESAAVENHLAGCAGCQVCLSGLKAGLELLRQAHREEPAPAAFTAVRSRVMSQLEREARPFWRRGWLLGVATAAALLVVGVAVQPGRWTTPDRPAVALVHPPAPVVSPTPPKVEPVVVPVRRAQQRSRRKLGPREPVMVRLVTDDPDVIIYWISETRGED